jgi:cobaltochelatase CobS
MSNRTKETVKIADAFNLNVPQTLTIEAYAKPSHFTPKRDDNYQFRQEVLSDVLAWWALSAQLDDGLYLTGPTGSGKSSVICQIAARLNWSVQRLTAHSRMEMPELVGHHVVIDGDLVWQDGPLTIAMREGHLFLLDELDLLDPATAAGLNGIVEGAPLVIAENGGEVITPHEDFRFVATGNTNGAGDRTGLFQGTLQQNAALMDRMWVVEVGYPVPEQEKAILSAVCPQLPGQLVDTMINVANEIRGLFMGEDGNPGAIEVTMSTRTMVRWAHMSWFFQGKSKQGVNPIDYALDRALANRASPETKRALHEIVQRHFGK